WVRPYEVSKASTTKSGVLRPTTDTGSSGSAADFATASANGRFLLTSPAISVWSSGKMKWLTQSSGRHWSSGSTFAAESQVDISGVKPNVPYRTVAWLSVSPLVVYSSAEMSGS